MFHQMTDFIATGPAKAETLIETERTGIGDVHVEAKRLTHPGRLRQHGGDGGGSDPLAPVAGRDYDFGQPNLIGTVRDGKPTDGFFFQGDDVIRGMRETHPDGIPARRVLNGEQM